MFYGREKELEVLKKMYRKQGFEMLVLYGRRRIGKTTLISHFIHGKHAIYFSAQEVLFKSFLPEINSFIGGPFEEICMQYMARKNNLSLLPFIYTQFERWRNSNSEIDIV